MKRKLIFTLVVILFAGSMEWRPSVAMPPLFRGISRPSKNGFATRRLGCSSTGAFTACSATASG